MKKKILALLKVVDFKEIRFFRGDGNSVNWEVKIYIGLRCIYTCYGYYVGDPSGQNSVLAQIQKDIDNKFKHY